MTDDFIKSNEFLSSYEWRKLRQEVLLKYKNKCMCCGAEPSTDGVILNVDHIKPRKAHPEYALNINNLQILCNACNHGKSNWHTEDWRDDKTFIVTKDWLDSHRTDRGGVTGVQMKALGLKGKPKKGWFKSLVGTRITEEARRNYETGRNIKAKEARELKNQASNKDNQRNDFRILNIDPIESENRALRARIRYIGNKSSALLDQIVETASLDIIDVWLEVFSDLDDVSYRLRKLT